MAKNKQKVQEFFWEFPSTNYGEEQGFSDDQTEHFEGDYEYYIARETLQNSVDARADKSKPVVVVFENIEFKTTDVPGRDMLVEKMGRCLDFVHETGNDPKAESFFENAIELFKGKFIPVLKISDYNTTGLTGSDHDRTGGWYKLVKATGQSHKPGNAGGSFGIGKGAPFAASATRTVFYSTLNDTKEHLFQGKARLMSHRNEDEDVRQRVGFFGNPRNEAIRESNDIPSLFKRSEQGTDVFIIGYKTKESWHEKIIHSVLVNFWLTIYQGDLEVIVKDEETRIINAETIKENLERYEPENARFYYESVVNFNERFVGELKNLGQVTLYVRKQENYPSKVMMVRKPKMLVTQKASRALKEPYAAVFICDDDRGNMALREMEPPAHDKWDKNRAKNKSLGVATMKELDEFITSHLKKMGDNLSTEPQDIPGLERYLPDTEDRDYAISNDAASMEETEDASERETGKEVGKIKDSTLVGTEKIVRKGVIASKQAGFIAPKPPTGPGNKGAKPAGPEGGDVEGHRINTSNIIFRSFISKVDGNYEYHFLIKSSDDCEGSIKIAAVGDDNSYPMDLISALDTDTKESYEIEGSLISGLRVNNGKTLHLSVKLKSPKKYALAIENYEG